MTTDTNGAGGLPDVLDFVNRQPCRCMSVAQLGERDYCDRCRAKATLRGAITANETAMGLADEYKAWLDCYHAGGDFPEFLSKRIGETP